MTGPDDLPSRSIAAYDRAERVARYDADMDLMHPNRRKMVDLAVEFLPLPRAGEFTAVDLGCGTGYFTRRFLERFPGARVIAVDGSANMIELAQARLGGLAMRVEFRCGDFRELYRLVPEAGSARVVFSSYALHHLSAAEKAALARQAHGVLAPDGWLVNADLIVAGVGVFEERIQQLRVDGILSRAAGRDPRFTDAPAVRRFLDELEAGDGDQPLGVEQDLAVFSENGFPDAGIVWLEHREAVVMGRKGK